MAFLRSCEEDSKTILVANGKRFTMWKGTVGFRVGARFEESGTGRRGCLREVA